MLEKVLVIADSSLLVFVVGVFFFKWFVIQNGRYRHSEDSIQRSINVHKCNRVSLSNSLI